MIKKSIIATVCFVILACVIYFLLAFIFSTFDILRFDKDVKFAASFFYLVGCLMIILGIGNKLN